MVLKPEYLLSQNLPPILESISPRKILGKKWWEAERKNKSSQEKCIICGTSKHDKWCSCQKHFAYKKYLEAHEIYDIDYQNETVELKDVVLICHSCHDFIHLGRIIKQHNDDIISKDYLVNIISHGIEILRQSKFEPTGFQAYCYLLYVLDYNKDDAYEVLEKKNLISEKFIVNNTERWKMIVKGVRINK